MFCSKLKVSFHARDKSRDQCTDVRVFWDYRWSTRRMIAFVHHPMSKIDIAGTSHSTPDNG